MSAPEDPKRWSDSGPSALGDLFAAAQRDIPKDSELEQLAARLEPTFSSPTVAPPMRWAKLAAYATVGAALVGGGYRLLRPTHAPSAPAKQVAASSSAAAPQPETSPVMPPEPASAPSTPLPASSASPAPRPALVVESEAALLERARRELSRNPASALGLANEHARRFPRGMLSQEREVIAVAALRQLGRTAEADRRAARFDASFPHSAHQRTIDGPTR